MDKKNFEINLLTTNTNASKLYNQATAFKVNNVIITNVKKYLLWKNF